MNTTPKITVGNVRNGLLPDHDLHLYCGRGRVPYGMVGVGMGNTFEMNDQSDAERNRVCDEYEAWINSQSAGEWSHNVIQRITQRVNEGKSVALYCWCAPKRCHCDTIKLIVLEQLESFSLD